MTSEDDPRLKDEVIWVVELSDGVKIYQSDFRDDKKDTWLDLKVLIESTDLLIVKMWLKFRSHLEELPVSKVLSYIRGVVFDASAGASSHSFVTGTEKDYGNLTVTTWKVPEIIKFLEPETKPKEKYLNRIIYNERIPF